jgi:membrane-associated phospholipid phosphatase
VSPVSSTPRARAATRRPAGALAAAGVGLALFLLSVPFAAGGTVPGWERAVFRAVNGLPGGLERTMWVLQLPGVLLVPLLFAAVAAGFRRWRLAAGLVLLIPLKHVVELDVVKRLVERQRPGRNEPGAILRDVPAAGLSFPSGHAIIAFGIATLLAPYLSRRWQVVAVAVATGVCVSRVYLGAHNPLDVTAGAGVGIVLGAALTLLLGVRRPPR